MRRAEGLPPAARRFVVIDPAFLGDVVFDGPLVRGLRLGRDGAFVGLVVRPPADALAARMVGVDRVHVFDKRGRDRGLRGLLRVARALAAERYEVAIVTHPSLRSALLARLAGIPRRLGSAPGPLARWVLEPRRWPPGAPTFVGERVALLGGPPGPSGALLQGTLRGAPWSRRGTRARVGLALGAQWATKRWPVEQAARFVRGLDAGRAELVLIGAEHERPRFAPLRAAAGPTRLQVEDRIGGGADALVDAIATLDVLVAGDTGPLHVARALGVPVVGLFGPTSEARHAFTPRDEVLSVEGLACRPCSAHGDRRCPEGHHRCMEELPAGRVLGAVERALGVEAGR